MSTPTTAKNAPVRWIGRTKVVLENHPAPKTVIPIRIDAHAIADNQPIRLLLSPQHAVHVDGVLIQVHRLVNGSTVRPRPIPEMMHCHLELDAPDVILAEGLSVETYLDAGHRDGFQDVLGASPPCNAVFETGADHKWLIWELFGCAPLVLAGAALDKVRDRLAQRSARMAESVL